MYFSMAELSGEQRSKIMHSTVLPRPIAWITSQDADGRVNAAPFSFFNVISGNPPLLCACIGTRAGQPKDTVRNIVQTREFVVNLVSGPLLHRMAATAIDFGPQVDEADEARLRLAGSRQVAPPRVQDSPAAYECRVRDIHDIDGVRSLIVAEVLGAHIMDAAVQDPERMYFDSAPMDLVARLQNPGWYGRIAQPFQLPTPSPQQWEAMKRAGSAVDFLDRAYGQAAG